MKISSAFRALVVQYSKVVSFSCRITKFDRKVVCKCSGIWVSGEVDARPFDVYLALASTHVPEFFPTGFYLWFRARLVYGSGID